ncbi:hypothetical protein TNCV_3433461 [Trichonephila clavipes]|nr:hypothetical protein TNCV_3433461 [Trichonephila clavipes]
MLLLLWLILSLSDGVKQYPKDLLTLKKSNTRRGEEKVSSLESPSSPRYDLERLAESCTWCKEQKSSCLHKQKDSLCGHFSI